MKNKYDFKYPVDVVFQAVSQMVVDNANVHVDHKYSLDKLDKIDYSFIVETTVGPLKNFSKVVEVVQDEKIAYTIQREKMETYLVSFNLSAINDNKTHLLYEFVVQTEKSSTSLNHAVVSYLYRRKQVKKFKEMCAYLNNQCEDIISQRS